MAPKGRESLSLPEAVSHMLEECRMVLPGITALFGFQLIAVFNSSFEERLSEQDQVLHLVAVCCVIAAIVLVMTPAAYHRMMGLHEVSDEFLARGGRLLLWSMGFLAVGISLDFYIIVHVILGNRLVGAAMSAFLLFGLVACWFLLPWRNARGNRA